MSDVRVSSRRLADAVARAMESGERVRVSDDGRGAVVVDGEDAAIFAGFAHDLAGTSAQYGTEHDEAISIATVRQRLREAIAEDASLAALFGGLARERIDTIDVPLDRAVADGEEAIRAVTSGRARIQVMDAGHVVAEIMPSDEAAYFALIEDIIDDELARQTLSGSEGELADWSSVEPELDQSGPSPEDA